MADITPEQFQDYQQQLIQPVADGDEQGQKQKTNAAYWMAYCYWYGEGGVRDDDEARRILEQVIREQDIIDGDNHHDNTGKHRYLLAIVIQLRHVERAKELRRQAIPRLELEVQLGGNDENYQQAAYYLGHGLFFGQGVDEDQPRGIHWLKKAAELEHTVAQHVIEINCFQEPFVTEIVSWWHQIADQNNNPWAQYRLGRCYREGSGVKKDFVKAVEWYNNAIAQGHDHATEYKHWLLESLSLEARNKTMGCVARNQKIEKAKSLTQQSFAGVVPLSLWPHAIATFLHQEHPPWEASSPTFLSLKDAIMPQLWEQSKKQQKKSQKRDLQSSNEKPGPFKRPG